MICKYHKDCNQYREGSETCNQTGGMYYDDLFDKRPAGCFNKMAGLMIFSGVII